MNPTSAVAATATRGGEWDRCQQRIREYGQAAALKLQQFQAELRAAG
jgi:hypothetical protein